MTQKKRVTHVMVRCLVDMPDGSQMLNDQAMPIEEFANLFTWGTNIHFDSRGGGEIGREQAIYVKAQK